MKRFINMVSQIIACGLLMSLTTGCRTDQLPNNTVLSLSPTNKTILISSQIGQEGVGCLATGYPYLDVPYVFVMRDAQGSPLGDIPVNFYADWTGQSSGATNGPLLMFDFNGDGVTDPGSETVSNVNDELFERTTQQYSGEIRLTLRLNLSCPYRGELVAFAGGYHISAEFLVELESEPEPEPAPEEEITEGLIE